MMATLVGNYMFQISVGTVENAEDPTPEAEARRLLQDADPVDEAEK